MSRPITGTISGATSELPFDPAKANRYVSVWFHHDDSVWFGVAVSSEFIFDTPTLHEFDSPGWVALCEVVGDHWRWDGSGVPYGFELTDIDFGDYAPNPLRDLGNMILDAVEPIIAPVVTWLGKRIGRKGQR